MDRHEQLLEAAAKRFALYGFRRTVVDDVARDAGIAKGSVYLHVQNKDELFRQTLRRERGLMAKAAREAIPDGAGPREAIQALTLRVLDWIDERPLLGRLMIGDVELGLGPELARLVEEDCHDEQALFGLVAEHVEHGRAGGEFRGDLSVEAAVTVVVSIFHIHLHNNQQRFIQMEPATYTRELLRILFEGIVICERGGR